MLKFLTFTFCEDTSISFVRTIFLNSERFEKQKVLTAGKYFHIKGFKANGNQNRARHYIFNRQIVEEMIMLNELWTKIFGNFRVSYESVINTR